MGKSTFSGPVSGAYGMLHIYSKPTTTTGVIDLADIIPTGMKFVCFGVQVWATVVTAAVFEMGTAADPNAYITTAAGIPVANKSTFIAFDGVGGSSVEIVSATAADLDLDFTVTTTLTDCTLHLVGYWSAQTTVLNSEGV